MRASLFPFAIAVASYGGGNFGGLEDASGDGDGGGGGVGDSSALTDGDTVVGDAVLGDGAGSGEGDGADDGEGAGDEEGADDGPALGAPVINGVVETAGIGSALAADEAAASGADGPAEGDANEPEASESGDVDDGDGDGEGSGDGLGVASLSSASVFFNCFACGDDPKSENIQRAIISARSRALGKSMLV